MKSIKRISSVKTIEVFMDGKESGLKFNCEQHCWSSYACYREDK